MANPLSLQQLALFLGPRCGKNLCSLPPRETHRGKPNTTRRGMDQYTLTLFELRDVSKPIERSEKCYWQRRRGLGRHFRRHRDQHLPWRDHFGREAAGYIAKNSVSNCDSASVCSGFNDDACAFASDRATRSWIETESEENIAEV